MSLCFNDIPLATATTLSDVALKCIGLCIRKTRKPDVSRESVIDYYGFLIVLKRLLNEDWNA